MQHSSDYIRFFDTTLRDGEQSPGATMTSTEKLEVCLLYTSDAADERSSVDLGGRRIIKKKIKD